MQDRNPQVDNPSSEKHQELVLNPAELGIPVPLIRPLSIEEIFKVERTRLGLRNTSPKRLGTELVKGVRGDYVVISNIGNFLKLKQRDPFQLGIDTTMFDETFINAAIDQDRVDLLEGLELLPEKYNQALLAYFKEAQTIRMNNIFHEGNENMTLEEYFDRYLEKYIPAYLLIQGNKNESPSSYDTEKYYGFGKHGKQIIRPEAIIAHCQFSREDIKILLER